MYLITYRCESDGREIWGYTIEEDVMEFLAETQEHEGEIYFIVNVLSITDDQAKKWKDNLKGM